MRSAEALASSCSRLFSQDREQEASSEQDKEWEKKLEDLQVWFSSKFPELLRCAHVMCR